MALTYTYGNSANNDPNNQNPDNPYYLFSITNGRSAINKYYRDTSKQIWRITYPDDNSERFTYNSFGQKTYHLLRDGSSENWQYDGSGRVTAYWDAAHPTTGNPTTRYQYDNFGRVSKTTEGRGNATDPGDPDYTTSLEYNARGQQTKLIHADGTFVQSIYNPNGTLASTTDELGHTIEYTYDDYKRVRTVKTPLRAPGDASPRTTTTCYDDGGQCNDGYNRIDAKPTKVTSPGGKVVTTSYDENLRVTSVTAMGDAHVPNGTTAYAYDAVGNRGTVTDPNGNVTTNYYDKQNRLRAVDDPLSADRNSDGHTVSYIYDEGGNKTQEKRVDNKICYYVYNQMGKLTKKTGFGGEITSYAYDRLGNVREMIDPKLAYYDYEYDGLSRKLTAKYPTDIWGTRRTEIYHYDVGNHLDSYTNPSGQAQTLQYDTRGRLANTSWSANQGVATGPTVSTIYDDASRPTNTINSDGTTSTTIAYHYDDANNKIWEEQSISSSLAVQAVQPLSAVSRKTHGSAGTFDVNLALTGIPSVECRSPGANNAHQLVINFAASVTFTSASVTTGTGTVSNTSGSGTSQVTVDLTGVTNAQTITVTLLGVNGGTGTVAVQMGVLLGDTSNDGYVNSADIAQTKSQSGNTVASSNFREDVTGDGSLNSGDIGLVKSKSGTGLPAPTTMLTHRVETHPDADGNRMDMLVKTGATTNYANTYQYTSRNGLLQVSDGTHSFTYHYGDINDKNGNVMQRTTDFVPGDGTMFEYDALNRPKVCGQSKLNGNIFATSHYDYTIRGNLKDTYRDEDGKGEYYTYDFINQLSSALYSADGVQAQNPSNPQSSVTYECLDFLNRNKVTVTNSAGQNSVTGYSANNLNQYDSVGGQSLQYDTNFNLTSYLGWSYSYDAQNRLLSATNGAGHSAQFVYDGVGRCVKRVIDGTTTVFTYDGWKQVAEWDGGGNLVATNMYGIGIDEILFVSNQNGQFYFKSDPMGNVRFVLNAAGTMVESYTYDAFGAATIKDASGTVISDSAVGNRFMYKGREYLASLGVYDSRKRIYHADLGRFLQVDPKGFGGGDPHNLYRFCMHNPLTGSDPMGEDFSGLSLGGDPTAFGFTDDPFGFSYPSLFANLGAFGAPIADVIKVVNAAPGDTAGAPSGTAVTQIGNMGNEQGSMPDLAGCGLQYGNDSAAAKAQVYGVGTGLSAALPTLNSGWYPVSREAYHAILVQSHDGSESIPGAEVKNKPQAALFHVPPGSSVPYVLPDNKDPQQINADTHGMNGAAFLFYWRPKGLHLFGAPNDWKQGSGNAKYDAAANFMFGESGTVNGFSGRQLQDWGEMGKFPGHNSAINVQDIQAGIDAAAISGGAVIAVPVNFP